MAAIIIDLNLLLEFGSDIFGKRMFRSNTCWNLSEKILKLSGSTMKDKIVLGQIKSLFIRSTKKRMNAGHNFPKLFQVAYQKIVLMSTISVSQMNVHLHLMKLMKSDKINIFIENINGYIYSNENLIVEVNRGLLQNAIYRIILALRLIIYGCLDQIFPGRWIGRCGGIE